MAQEGIPQIIRRIPWFVELTPQQVETLTTISLVRQLTKDEILFHEGDAEDCLFILLEGQAEATVHVPGHGSIFLYHIDPLDVVGWSVLTPVVRQRTATIRALTDCQILCLNSSLLRQACESDHDLGYIVMKRIANVVASRLLVTRLHLFDLLRQSNEVHTS